MADAMNASPDDQALRALMASYQEGRFEAFDELYGLVAPAVRRFLTGRIRDAARTEDVVQETFLQMHRARRSYDPAYPVVPWVMAWSRASTSTCRHGMVLVDPVARSVLRCRS